LVPVRAPCSLAADMMHDAVRGDAKLALLGALRNEAKRVADASDGLAEHGNRFNADLDKLQTLALRHDGAEALASGRQRLPPHTCFGASADAALARGRLQASLRSGAANMASMSRRRR
jgi:hypothetical protein